MLSLVMQHSEVGGVPGHTHIHTDTLAPYNIGWCQSLARECNLNSRKSLDMQAYVWT